MPNIGELQEEGAPTQYTMPNSATAENTFSVTASHILPKTKTFKSTNHLISSHMKTSLKYVITYILTLDANFGYSSMLRKHEFFVGSLTHIVANRKLSLKYCFTDKCRPVELPRPCLNVAVIHNCHAHNGTLPSINEVTN